MSDNLGNQVVGNLGKCIGLIGMVKLGQFGRVVGGNLGGVD